nr:hypothetical protein [Tanacetum cinerariifolium]
EEGQDADDDKDKLYRDVNINLEGRVVQMADVHTTKKFKDTHVTLTLINPDGQQQSSSVSSQFVTSMLNPTPNAGIDSLFEITSQMDVLALTTVASVTLYAPTLTLSTIPTISTVPQAPTPSTTTLSNLLYMDQRMNEAVKNLDENIQKNIKEQVKEHVKISYAVAADLSEMELKRILIKKMESNKSIHRSDEQRNLYKALDEAYEIDKIILDTYGDIFTLKRRRDDDVEKDKEPFAGSDRGSKRRREGKEPESTSALKEKSLVELEFFLEEVYKANTDQLDLNNPKGQQYPLNLIKPLPLIPNSRGRRVIPFDHFINNDLEYLCGGASSQKYTTSVTNKGSRLWAHQVDRRLGALHNVESRTDCRVAQSQAFGLDHADKSDDRRTLCFQRLSKNVYKKNRHLKAYGRPSIRCQKLPKEAQPHKAGYVAFRSEAQRGLHRLLQSKMIHLSE